MDRKRTFGTWLVNSAQTLLTAVVATTLLTATATAKPTEDGGPGVGDPPLRVEMTERPAVLAMVAEDAAGAVIVPKLGLLEARVAALAKAMKVEEEEAGAMVTTMLKKVGIAEGVDLKRGAALVMPELAIMDEPIMLVALPVTDPEKFKTNFDDLEETDAARGIFSGTAKNGSMDEAYMRFENSFAILSNNQNALKLYSKGKADGKVWARLGKVGQTQLMSNSATVYVNLEKIGPMVAPLLQMGLGQAKAQMMKDEDVAEQMGGAEAAAAILDAYGKAAKAVLTNGQAFVIGVGIEPTGATINYGVQFKKDSEPAKMFSPKVPPSVSLDRLPSDPTLAAFAMDARAVDLSPVAKSFTELAKKVPEGAPMGDVIRGYAKSFESMALVDQVAAAWYSPPMKDGEIDMSKLFKFAFVYTSDKPKELLRLGIDYNEKMVDAVSRLAEAQEEGTGEQVRKMMKFERGVEKVEGESVDRWRLDLEAMAKQPGAAPLPEGMQKEFDLYATATDKAMLGATGPSMDLLKATLGAADGSGKLGRRSEFGELRRHLPADRCLEMFIDTRNLARFIAGLTDEPMNKEEFEKLSPMAMSMTSRGGGFGATAFVPTGVLQGMAEGMRGMLPFIDRPRMGPGF